MKKGKLAHSISTLTFAVLYLLQNACKMFKQVVLLPPVSDCDFLYWHPVVFVLPGLKSLRDFRAEQRVYADHTYSVKTDLGQVLKSKFKSVILALLQLNETTAISCVSMVNNQKINVLRGVTDLGELAECTGLGQQWSMH